MVTITTEQTEGEALKAEVDQDIAEFELWFQGLGNDALVNSETAILRTYVYFKTRVQGRG